MTATTCSSRPACSRSTAGAPPTAAGTSRASTRSARRRHSQSRAAHSEPAARQNGTPARQDGYPQGGAPVPASAAERYSAGRRTEYQQGGDSATPGTRLAALYHARGIRRQNNEHRKPPSARVTPTVRRRTANGGGEAFGPEEELCEALLAAWEPALGDSPRHDSTRTARRWLDDRRRAARSATRANGSTRALAYMVTDEILGSAGAHDARVREGRRPADRPRLRPPAAPKRTGLADTPAPRCRDVAGGQAGTPARDPAPRPRRIAPRRSQELAAHNALLVRFVERVKWSSLCEQPFRYVERRYAELWAELTDQANEPQRSRRMSTTATNGHQRPATSAAAAQPRGREVGARRRPARRAPPLRARRRRAASRPSTSTASSTGPCSRRCWRSTRPARKIDHLTVAESAARGRPSSSRSAARKPSTSSPAGCRPPGTPASTDGSCATTR